MEKKREDHRSTQHRRQQTYGVRFVYRLRAHAVNGTVVYNFRCHRIEVESWDHRHAHLLLRKGTTTERADDHAVQ